MKITELNPKEVFYWFNEICKIPHGSDNTEMITDFCVRFAEERNLEYHRDSTGNVIIYKSASPDKKDSGTVILQGHLDMVCDKTAECGKDMLTDGITPMTDGEYVWADGTTLGADDGIAAAYILAILDSDNISHPPVEALLTVGEEIGLIGANALDCSRLKGKRLINIDSEEEGILTVGCASGTKGTCEIPLNIIPAKKSGKKFIKLSVSGLLGGHSGIDIDKHRQNAIIVLGRLLYNIKRRFSINICSLYGGGKLNVIPHDAEAVILSDNSDAEGIVSAANEFQNTVQNELLVTEPGISVNAEEHGSFPTCADNASSDRIIFTLMQSPDGVVSMNPEIKGMVLSSLNMGIASIENRNLSLCYFLRSNDTYGQKAMIEKLTAFAGYLGGKIDFDCEYPAWEYKSDSELRGIMTDVYKEMYNSEPDILSIHAGLECGILSSKITDPDMVSFGPDIENAHTPNERLGVLSAKRCYYYLLAVLKKL